MKLALAPLALLVALPVLGMLAGAVLLPVLPCADMAARKVAANLVASAFFKYTT